MSGRLPLLLVTVSLCCLSAAPLGAQQMGLLSTGGLSPEAHAKPEGNGGYAEVDAGAIYTDNLLASSTDKTHETLATIGLNGEGSSKGTALEYNAAGDITLAKYLQGDFATQPFGSADAAGLLHIVPGLFSWTARETFTQPVINPALPLTPDNIENLNDFSTGPRLTLAPSATTNVSLGASYGIINSSSKSANYIDINNKRYGGDLTLTHALSGIANAFVTLDSEHVDFSNQLLNTNFTRDELVVGYSLQGPRTSVDASAGYMLLNIDDKNHSGFKVRLNLSRKISPYSTLTLHVANQYTDSAAAFRSGFDQGGGPSNQVNQLANSDPFRQKEYGATWAFHAARTNLTLDYLNSQEYYSVDPVANRTVKDVTVSAGRTLSPKLQLQIGAQYEQQLLTQFYGGSYDTLNGIASLRWQFAREVGMYFRYARSWRNSSSTYNAFSENQFGISVFYAAAYRR